MRKFITIPNKGTQVALVAAFSLLRLIKSQNADLVVTLVDFRRLKEFLDATPKQGWHSTTHVNKNVIASLLKLY